MPLVADTATYTYSRYGDSHGKGRAVSEELFLNEPDQLADRKEAFDVLRGLLSALPGSAAAAEISDDESLPLADLPLDSLDWITLGLSLEQSVGMSISDEQIEGCVNVGDLLSVIVAVLAGSR